MLRGIFAQRKKQEIEGRKNQQKETFFIIKQTRNFTAYQIEIQLLNSCSCLAIPLFYWTFHIISARNLRPVAQSVQRAGNGLCNRRILCAFRTPAGALDIYLLQNVQTSLQFNRQQTAFFPKVKWP
jgi:hypothetical protein